MLTRLSWVALVLTLLSRKEEGHLAYRSQSDNPLQGTTLGGSTDDPGREHTRNAAARHSTGAGGRRQCGVPRGRDLAHRVLPLAAPAGTLRGRWRASAPAAGPTGTGAPAAGADAQIGRAHV